MKRKRNNNNNNTLKKKETLENLQDFEQSYYDRLVHQCRKDLHKQAKMARNLECQKLIRNIKKEQAVTTTHTSTATRNTVVAKCRRRQEQKLKQLKDFADWEESLLTECFRRLGVFQLVSQPSRTPVAPDNKHETITTRTSIHHDHADSNNSDETKDDASRFRKKRGNNHEKERILNRDSLDIPETPNGKNHRLTTSNDNSKTTTTWTTAAINTEKNTAWIFDRILKHKRMVVALGNWSEQIAEFRRWRSKQQQQQQQQGSNNHTIPSKKRKKAKANDMSDIPDIAGNQASSLFLTLGGGDESDDDDNDKVDKPVRKKNRQGQRARRAKAQAMETAEAAHQQQQQLPGTHRNKKRDESLNWRMRDKHSSHTSKQTSRTDNNRAAVLDDNHQEKKQTVENTTVELHPSWQARKQQKEGIVAFQGKKITFE
jgi:hypothetical protein